MRGPAPSWPSWALTAPSTSSTRRQLAGATPERRAELVELYRQDYANPYLAAERGYIDDVIDPASTRRVLAQSLEVLATKRQEAPARKHGNVPL